MGLFITFEGIEGCGKTTQIHLLADFLSASRIPFIVTREPGGSSIGNKIRAILLDTENSEITSGTELLLYAADRIQHVETVILPALREGKTVLCDRFSDATRAYQGYGRGIPQERIEALERQAGVDRRPDLTLLLDLEVAPALDRTRCRERQDRFRSRYDREDEAFHRRVREGYLAVCRREEGRVRRVDASGGVEETHDRIRRIVDRFLDGKEGS